MGRHVSPVPVGESIQVTAGVGGKHECQSVTDNRAVIRVLQTSRHK
jgi:hypothetical protein